MILVERATTTDEDDNRVGVGALLNRNDDGIWAGHARVLGYHEETSKWIQIGEDIDGLSWGDISG